MIRARQFIACIWCLLIQPATVSLWAQLPHYQLSQVTAQEGLKTADLNHLMIDHEGFMWVAAQNNVQRFDGRHTLHFPFDETVIQVYADVRQRIWAVGRGQVYLYSNSFEGFASMPVLNAGNSSVIRLFEREDSTLIMLRNNGWYQWNEEKKVFEVVTHDAQKGTRDFRRYFTSMSGTEYYVSGDSILAYNTASKTIRSVPLRSTSSLVALGSDLVLASTSRFQTYLIQPSRNRVIPVDPPVVAGNQRNEYLYVHSAVPMQTNTWLLATSSGLWYFDTGTVKLKPAIFYYNGQPLQHQNAVRSLFADAAGKIYLGHPDGLFILNLKSNGIQYLRNYGFNNRFLPDNDVRSFSEDEKGNIWMATTNGIAKLNPLTGEVEALRPLQEEVAPDYPSYRYVLNLGAQLWIGTSGNGVWLLHKGDGRYERPLPEPSADTGNTRAIFNATYIWKLQPLVNDQMFVAGEGRSYLLNTKSLRYRPVDWPFTSGSSRTAWLDSSGRFWHGAVAGLSCFTKDYRLAFALKDTFPDKRIAAFCEREKDHMLIGTRGLYEAQVEGDQLRSFKRLDGFPANRFIYCMQQDRQGMIWLGTDDGMYRYNPLKDESVRFDESDFVQNQAFNSQGAFMSSKGLMYMGGKNGFNYFLPEVVTPLVRELQPAIQSFLINGSDSLWLSKNNPLVIPYSSRNIDFTITAPDFLDPFDIRYRYRFVNTDSVWVSTGYSDRVRIQHADPGKYVLEIAASSDGKNWFSSRDLLVFEIAHPWWQTLWFRLLAATVLLAAAIVMRRYWLQRQQQLQMDAAVQYFAHSGNSQSSGEILWDIARNCIARLGFEDCVLYLLDDEGNVLVQKAAYGKKNPKHDLIANPIEIPIGRGITGAAASTGHSILVNDTSKDPRYIVDDLNRFSELAVPIIHESKVIGVIDSEHPEKHFFTSLHRHTLERIAAICASKIVRAMAMESVQEAEARLAVLNAKMMEAKFMNLRLQMNPHFLFNTLTSIQYLVVSGQTTKATSYLNIFSGFLRALLQYAEETAVSLQEEIRILHMYVELETLSLDESFEYNIEVDESIDEEDVLVPFMILQPFVENAIHHGLQHRLTQKRFDISITNEHDENIVCIITDNGIGRAAAAAIKQRKMRAARHESKGVLIVQQRLELLQQKTGKFGGLSYEDLYDSAGEPAGTRVTIIIPYYNTSDL